MSLLPIKYKERHKDKEWKTANLVKIVGRREFRERKFPYFYYIVTECLIEDPKTNEIISMYAETMKTLGNK